MRNKFWLAQRTLKPVVKSSDKFFAICNVFYAVHSSMIRFCHRKFQEGQKRNLKVALEIQVSFKIKRIVIF